MALTFAERPADGRPDGLLVLHHGRGTSEADLMPLADVLDPDRRLHVAAPRGPLRLPDAPGFHWYRVPQVGHPDAATFAATRAALAAFHDELWDRTGTTPERTVLGGFSMGTVMSYTMALDGERPPVAGILAFSGFIPTVSGWQAALAGREATRVFITHGTLDPVIGVAFAREARGELEAAGLTVDYREFRGAHFIDPEDLERAAGWLGRVLA